jgi:hypothetical protein
MSTSRSTGSAQATIDQHLPWVHLAAWCVVGGILQIMPLVWWILRTLATLCHEFGHAAANWMFGRPAIPAFDFSYGGGFTSHRERMTVLVIMLALGWVMALVQVRHQRAWLIATAVACGGWLVCIACSWDEAIVVAMGHGGVLAIALVFLFRAQTGVAEHFNGERHLYGAVGFALWWEELGFAWRLLHDDDARDIYLEGKRGVDNDLVRLAHDHLNWHLNSVAWAYVVLLLVGVIAVIAVARWWLRLNRDSDNAPTS